MRWWLLIVTLAGCPPTTDKSGSDEGTTDDTDTVATWTLSGTVSIPVGTAVADEAELVVLPVEFGDEEILVGDPWVGSTLTGIVAGAEVSFSVDIPLDPLESDQYPADTDGAATLATYIVGVYADSDSSGGPSTRDVYYGASRDILGWIDGEVDEQMTTLGAQLGWNVMGFDEQDLDTGPVEATPVSGAHTGFDWVAGALAVDPGPLTVTFGADLGTDLNLDLYAYNAFLGFDAPQIPTVVSLDVANAIMDSTVTLSPPFPSPLEDHYQPPEPGSPEGLQFAIYTLVAYHDTSGNDSWDHATEPSLGLGHQFVVFSGVSSFDATFTTALLNLPVGWGLLVEAEDIPVFDAWETGVTVGGDP